MSHVGAGASGHMKTNSSHPSSVKLLSVKEAQDAYNNVQASMAAAQHAGNATRASIQSLRAKLKASLGQLQQVAAAENYDKAVWSPVSVSNGKDEHQHVYSILDVLEYVMSGQWPASIQLRHVDSSEQRQLSDLVSEQSWSLVTAALSVQQELNALHKQESAHLCKVDVAAPPSSHIAS
jgi:delta 1-pyrroline-5-carboxylate dehydrogenase